MGTVLCFFDVYHYWRVVQDWHDVHVFHTFTLKVFESPHLDSNHYLPLIIFFSVFHSKLVKDEREIQHEIAKDIWKPSFMDHLLIIIWFEFKKNLVCAN